MHRLEETQTASDSNQAEYLVAFIHIRASHFSTCRLIGLERRLQRWQNINSGAEPYIKWCKWHRKRLRVRIASVITIGTI